MPAGTSASVFRYHGTYTPCLWDAGTSKVDRGQQAGENSEPQVHAWILRADALFKPRFIPRRKAPVRTRQPNPANLKVARPWHRSDGLDAAQNHRQFRTDR